METDRLLNISRRLTKLATLMLVAKHKRKRKKRKDYAGSPADALDVTPGIGADGGGDGGDGGGAGGGAGGGGGA